MDVDYLNKGEERKSSMITMRRRHLYLMLWVSILTGQFILPLVWKTIASDDALLTEEKRCEIHYRSLLR